MEKEILGLLQDKMKNEKILKYLLMINTLFIVGCSICKKNMLIIENPNSTIGNIQMSISNLDETCIPNDYWNGLINDVTYPPEVKKLFIKEIFNRYIIRGTTLQELANLLNKPKWIKQEYIIDVSILAGKLPVDVANSGCVFVIHLYGNDSWPIYISFLNGISKEYLYECIQGNQKHCDQVKIYDVFFE